MSTDNLKTQAGLPVFETPESLLSLLRFSPDALLVVDQASDIVMVNEQAEALFGYAHGELAGQRLNALLPANFHSTHTAHLKQYFSAPRTRPMHTGISLHGKRKDGTDFPVDISLMPILLGKTRCVVGAIRDMTAAQHVMDEQLAAYREVEQHLSTLNTVLSATKEYVYLLDTESRYRFASENAANLFGMAQSDFLGKTWQDLGFPADFLEPFLEKFQKVLTTGQATMDEMPFPVNDEMRWFEYAARPVLGQDGAVESVVISSRDITERRQAEDTLHRLATIVESSSEAIWSETLDGVITSWNSGAEKLYGYCAEEVIGQSASLLFPPARSQEFWDLLARIKKGETVKDFETRRIRKDGTAIEVSINISPIPDHKGRIIGASKIAHNNTERKRLIRELLDANTALEDANQTRDQFLATMSHELRTPLASIIGFSEMLLDDTVITGMDPLLQDNLQRILKNGHHLLELVNDVLDLSKIEARRMDISIKLVDVKKLLTTVVEETQSIATARHLVLRTDVEEGIGCLDTDPLRLQQVLLNLVSNALKFTKQGEVLVSAKRIPSSEQQAESIAIAVKDSGIGIPLDKQEQIFEAFYQVDGSYTRQFGGTGLGLSIVSQFTRLLGGKLKVESASGQGSTFTVTLPIKAARPPVEPDLPRLHPNQEQETSTSLPFSGNNMHTSWLASVEHAANKGQSNVVLVVDDNPDAIALIEAALQMTSLTVVGVQDPKQVLGLVQTLRPCVITLDVMMPEINGWQLLNQLKTNSATASIPVVMISILSEQTTGYVLGADAYVLKPFKIGELLSTLRRILKPQQGAHPAHLREPHTVATGQGEFREENRT